MRKPLYLAPRMTRTAILNPGLGWPESMQVQLSKSNIGDARSISYQTMARIRQLPASVVAARTMGPC